MQESTTTAPENIELQTCKSQLDEWREKYLRVQADMDNFSRRMEKEKSTWMRVAQATMLKDLLTIVDDFDRAFAVPMTTTQDNQLLSGFELIAKSLQKFLTAQGLEEITQLTTFDPLMHEALMQVESAEHASGSVVQVLQKGYMFKGEVLRPAKVSVAS